MQSTLQTESGSRAQASAGSSALGQARSEPIAYARQRWMGLLARADAGRLAACVDALGPLPTHTLVRGPEHGLVMLRGRMGATGAPFNLGEMTVTRCTVRLGEGTIGHAYVQGRDVAKARNAAMVDAMLVSGQRAAEIEAHVLAPLEAAENERRAARTRQSAATKVEFFTMVRSEHGGRD